jgi:hypothetical protein
MSVFSVKAAVISGFIGLASVFAAGASAQAASPTVSASFTTQHGSPVVNINHRNGHYDRHQHRPNRYACSPRDASAKASRMGLRNTRVTSQRSTIRVSGYRHGRPAAVLFGKSRGCPVLR